MDKKKWISLLMVLVGNIIYAFSVKLFLLPANLMSCGTTGIALVVNQLTHIPISGFIFVFNVVMLAVGWMILGRKFAMTTILSSLLYPIALEILNRVLGDVRITENILLNTLFSGMGLGLSLGIVLGDVRITENILLNTLFSGMGLGLSLGIVLRAGASTGGMDIPPLVLKKFFRIPVSASLWAFDFCILLAQMTFHPLEDLLYGILLIIVVSITLNKVMLLGTSKTEVKIVSEKAGLIREAILSRVDRGVTILHGEGGYLRQKKEVIMSIVSNHELVKIENLARSIDPDCFMIISHVTEVWGRGFSYGKKALKAETDK